MSLKRGYLKRDLVQRRHNQKPVDKSYHLDYHPRSQHPQVGDCALRALSGPHLNPTAATSHPLILTLIDIKNGLLTHFMGASTYTVEDDTESLFKVDPKEDGPDFAARIKDIVVVGLDELAALGLIKRVASGFYVLCAPLMQVNQSVVISPLTAWMLADLVNHWVESTGERKETGYVVNKLVITDRDVAALCHISQTLLGAKTEPGFEDDPEDGDEDPERLGLPS